MDAQNIIQDLTSWFWSSGIRILVILLVAFLAGRFGRKIITRMVKSGTEKGSKEAIEKRQKTLIRIFAAGLKIPLWLVAGMMVLSELGLNIGPILAGAGLLGVALGFGAQWMVRDFLAGIFIVMENQYRVGDVVCLDNTCGFVEDITLRKTIMRDLDGKVMHIPNGSFKMAANLTYGYSRAHLNISVAYKEDIDKVMDVINRVGKEMIEESPWKEDILKPLQVLGPGPSEFSASGIEIKVLGETRPSKQWDAMREFRRRVKKAFDKEGIEIPLPQMSVWSRGKWEK